MADNPNNPARHDADRVAPQSSGADHRAARPEGDITAQAPPARGASTQVEVSAAGGVAGYR